MVATVLTACGIETYDSNIGWDVKDSTLQQYLPLAVLKPAVGNRSANPFISVATVLTVCGIETLSGNACRTMADSCNSAYCLRYWNPALEIVLFDLATTPLQQCLLLAVLKHTNSSSKEVKDSFFVATVLTACGIETSSLAFVGMNRIQVATVLIAYDIDTYICNNP